MCLLTALQSFWPAAYRLRPQVRAPLLSSAPKFGPRHTNCQLPAMAMSKYIDGCLRLPAELHSNPYLSHWDAMKYYTFDSTWLLISSGGRWGLDIASSTCTYYARLSRFNSKNITFIDHKAKTLVNHLSLKWPNVRRSLPNPPHS